MDGALHATGESAAGYLHQIVVQRLYLLFAPACPPGAMVLLDTWWELPRGKLRPDLALYRPEDAPANLKSFRVPPWATLEVLSDDAHHDFVRKDGIDASLGVTRRPYIEPWGRFDWWCRLDDVPHTGPTATWELPGWPPLTLRRDELLAR
ncbi:MAG: hypothetical protein ACR2MA_09265 [Egibacteraceae bacterium]